MSCKPSACMCGGTEGPPLHPSSESKVGVEGRSRRAGAKGGAQGRSRRSESKLGFEGRSRRSESKLVVKGRSQRSESKVGVKGRSRRSESKVGVKRSSRSNLCLAPLASPLQFLLPLWCSPRATARRRGPTV